MPIRFVTLLFLLSPTLIFAQKQELGLYFMPQVWQNNLTNPAFLPEKKTVLSLPSAYLAFSSPDFKLNDIIIDQNGKRVLNYDTAFNRLKPFNNFNTAIEAQTLHLSFKAKSNVYMSIGHTFKGIATTTFPKELIKLYANGNADFVGQTIPIGFDLNAQTYSEIALGATVKLPLLTIGAKVKYLNGISGYFTERSKLNMSTDSVNYNLHFDSDFAVNTYKAGRLGDLNSVQNFYTQPIFTPNTGVSFDVGATFKLGPFQVNASIIDFQGRIKWKASESSNIASKGQYTYKGNNSDGFFNVDSLSSSSFQDTIIRVLNIQKTKEDYTSTIPTKAYIGTNLTLGKNNLGSLLYLEEYQGTIKTAFALSLQRKVNKAFALGLVYAAKNGKWNNLGVNTTLKLGPVQIYALTDNILSAFAAQKYNYFNARVGVNIVL